MAEENHNIAEAFAEATGAEIEVSPEASQQSAQEAETIEITRDESPLENIASQQETEENQEETPQEESSSDISEENDESSLTEDSDPEDENYQQEEGHNEEQVVDDDDALFVLNEKYGTDYDNLDDLLDDLEEQDRESGFASEQVEELNRFISETGRSAEDFIKTQTQDYDQMSDEQIIKEYLSMENPSLSKKEIDLFFDNTYRQDEDKFNAEETELGKVHLKRDVTKAREELLDLQDEYWAPLENEDGYTDEEIAEMEEKEDREIYEDRENFYDAMDTELDDIDSLSFEINDNGETFDYKLTEEDKQMVGDSLSNLDDFFEPYIDKDGNWDTESLALDMIAMRLQDRIIRSVANQYRSQGTEQVLKDIKNPSFEPTKVSQDKSGDSFITQVSKQIFGD